MKWRQVLEAGILALLLVAFLTTPVLSQTGQAVYSVQGHAIWELVAGTPEDDAQWIDQITINAWVDDNGEAHGTVTWTAVYHDVPANPEDPDIPPGPSNSGYPWKMDVKYLNVECNEASVLAKVVSSPQNPSDVGVLYLFQIADNGQGAHDPPDTIDGFSILGGDLRVAGGDCGPSGYISAPSWPGDCANRPSGSVCVQYNDGYIWLVYDSIQGWRSEGEWQGHPIQVATGYLGEYFHILDTNYVKYEPY